MLTAKQELKALKRLADANMKELEDKGSQLLVGKRRAFKEVSDYLQRRLDGLTTKEREREMIRIFGKTEGASAADRLAGAREDFERWVDAGELQGSRVEDVQILLDDLSLEVARESRGASTSAPTAAQIIRDRIAALSEGEAHDEISGLHYAVGVVEALEGRNR